MQFVRVADLRMVSYQRQGRMYTYPPSLGQEAIHAGVGKLIRDEDWLIPAFRELGMWMLKGGRLRDHFLYWGGHEDGSKFSDAPRIYPISVPITTQLVHAVGVGYGVRYRKEDRVVFTLVGDGGTSEGSFHEALNFAGVWKVPVVFVIENNQYAISVPVNMQTAAKNLAIKSCGYGIPGIKVDGNDFFALYRSTQEAREHAQSGKGPVLIEALTYRMGAHTTSDDPTLYRTKEEEDSWRATDPINRLKSYLVNKGVWNEDQEESLIEQYKKEIDEEFEGYENYPKYELEDVFKYHYTEMPDQLRRQKEYYEEYLAWKEAQ
jgi:pyruvate dehydrogenase E1 component alpha subunit